jgi:small subunit ribosomal protein S6
MNTYDLTIVLAGGITPAKKTTLRKKIEELVKTEKGKLVKVNEWGELDLAYPIAKNKTGIFLLFTLELESERAKEIDKKLNLEEGIIRYLLVRKE